MTDDPILERNVLNRRNKLDRTDHLRSGVIFLVAWIGVAIAEVREFREGGLLHHISRIKEGDVLPLLLVSASIVLLALAIRSFVLYFKDTASQ